jgi:hypothetical protein
MSSDAPHILAIQATFDGQRIVLPDDVRGIPPGKVIVIFEDAPDDEDRKLWLRAQETAFAKAWNNPEDDIYDHL